jgi:hypothetical protein
MLSSLPIRQIPSFTSTSFANNTAHKKWTLAAIVAAALFAALNCLAQDPAQDQDKDQQQASQQPNSQPAPAQAATNFSTVTIPGGTRIALVLTQPIQTRYIHRGDDIYAQINSPVSSGNEVVIPIGTFVQGKVDKLERRGGRGEIRLQAMSITFPDGYVIPITDPALLVTDEGYALKDPGPGRSAAAFVLPFAGAGLGALIGYGVADKQPGTITASIPSGCVGSPPGCVSSSMTVPAHPGMSIGIGAVVGAAAGGIGALVMLVSSHHFYMDVGTPVEMTLQHPLSLQQNEVANAVQQSEQHPVAEQPVASRPLPPAPPATSTDHGTCWTPGTPGTPPTVIPGPPGPDGIPGPPTIIPGTPPTPGTPYPCP